MRRTCIGVVLVTGFVATAAMISCATTEQGSGYTGGGAGNGSGAGGGASEAGASGSDGMAGSGGDGAGGAIVGGPYSDFPASPVIDASSGIPASVPGLFGSAATGASGGPCVVEPESGTLFPKNWLRPRFSVRPASGMNMFEIRVHAASQVNDLVVYTSSTSWTMPSEMWKGLASHSIDQTVSVSIRGAFWDGTSLTNVSAPSPSGFIIAPVDASGSIVYWTTTGGSMLKGFTIGDETVAPTLTPPQVEMPMADEAPVACVGCHTSTPDGKFAGFTVHNDLDGRKAGPWSNAIASIEKGSEGTMPSFLGAGAITALQQDQLGIQTYSKAHWNDGDRIEIAPFGQGKNAKLAWFDLEATDPSEGIAYGFLARTGDSRGAGAPTWSHDGVHITYVSTDTEDYGRLGKGSADLYTIEYADKAGGPAIPVPGASDSSRNEYYPAYSADDAFLAFNRVANGVDMYDQKTAEIFVVPSGGGTPTRLAANDPPLCANRPSPGISNSWPKWSPEVQSANGKKYYWLIFSSRRNGATPQLFATAIVESGGTLTTYPALYLWNQPANESNHTPAWDVFKIPPADGPK